jgi:hypothetical protein
MAAAPNSRQTGKTPPRRRGETGMPIVAKLAAAGLALAAISTPAAAADEEAQQRDLRCLLAVAITGAQAPPSEETRQGLAAGVGFYMGRLKARDPAIDLSARLTALTKGMQIADLKGDFSRCGAEMKVFGAEAQDVGRALQAVGQAAAK